MWASGAGATYYVGGGKGIRVTFRVKDHKLVQADVVARLYCNGRHFQEQFDRIEREYATREDPLRLDRRGGFRWSTIGERQEEAFSQEEFLGGRVSGGSVMGKFEFFRSGGRRQTNCRTGSFPLRFGETAARFVARRQAAGADRGGLRLDPSFGKGGFVRTAAAPLAGGRLRANGAIDTDFGGPSAGGEGAGQVIPRDRNILAIAAQGRRILIAGGGGSGYVARLDHDGRLDPSFGEGRSGRITLPPAAPGQTRLGKGAIGALVVRRDGSFYAGGYHNGRFLLARLERDGSLDRSFGSGGIVRTRIATSAFGHDVAVSPSGAIFAAATSSGRESPMGGPGARFTVLRYSSDGRWLVVGGTATYGSPRRIRAVIARFDQGAAAPSTQLNTQFLLAESVISGGRNHEIQQIKCSKLLMQKSA